MKGSFRLHALRKKLYDEDEAELRWHGVVGREKKKKEKVCYNVQHNSFLDKGRRWDLGGRRTRRSY